MPLRARRRAAATCTALGALLSCLPLSAAPAHAVVGGETVSEDAYDTQFPWAVTVYSPVAQCGGTLIAPGFVVTAGHCVDPVPTSVGHGSAFLDQQQHTDVAGVVRHPTADLAVLELADTLPDVPPLPLATTAPAVGDTLTVLGWGLVDPAGRTGPPGDQLKLGKYLLHDVDRDRLVHLGEGDDSCLGDSGGPVVLEGELVGIVSGALETAVRPCGDGGVDVNVATHREFIAQAAGLADPAAAVALDVRLLGRPSERTPVGLDIALTTGSPAASNPPTGVVEVLEGTRLIASADAEDLRRPLRIPAGVLASGRHELTVAYTGDTAFQRASTTLVVDVR